MRCGRARAPSGSSPGSPSSPPPCASRRSACRRYHHDEIVTASRILRGSFWHAMDAVGFSESAPPLYYALAWVWTQLTGTGEFGLRSLSAARRGRHGPGRLPARRRAARPPRRDRRRGPGRGQPDAALVLAGGPRLRAPRAPLHGLGALLRPRARPRRPARHRPGGASPRRSPSPPTTSPIFPIAAEAVWLLARRGRDALRGLWRSSPSPVCCWRRWRSTRCPPATPSGSATTPSATGSGRRARPSLSARPATSSPGPSTRCWRLVPFLLVVAALALLARPRGRGEERRAARPAAGARRGDGRRSRWRSACSPRARTTSSPATCCPPWCRCSSPWRSASPCAAPAAPAPSLGAALVAYSLGFSIWASVSPALQRPDWDAVAAKLGEPARPRAMVTWTLGQASLRYYLSTGSFQVVQSERLPLVRARDRLHLRRPGAAAARAPARRPASARSATSAVGRLYVRQLRAARPRPGALRLRECATRGPQLPHQRRPRSTASGRAGSARVRCPDGYPGQSTL